MIPNDASLIGQGLALTVIGMVMVFGALAILWGIVEVLLRVAPVPGSPATDDLQSAEAAVAAETLTSERARVAAAMAAALMSSALPLHFEPPAGPDFEHGRTAPSWVTANRSRMLEPWHPLRPPEP